MSSSHAVVFFAVMLTACSDDSFELFHPDRGGDTSGGAPQTSTGGRAGIAGSRSGPSGTTFEAAGGANATSVAGAGAGGANTATGGRAGAGGTAAPSSGGVSAGSGGSIRTGGTPSTGGAGGAEPESDGGIDGGVDAGCSGPPSRGVTRTPMDGDKCTDRQPACPPGSVPYSDACGCGCRQDDDCPRSVDCKGPRMDPLCTEPERCPYTVRTP